VKNMDHELPIKSNPLYGELNGGMKMEKQEPVKNFGYDEAKRLAIQAREEAISSLPHYRDALNLDDKLILKNLP